MARQSISATVKSSGFTDHLHKPISSEPSSRNIYSDVSKKKDQWHAVLAVKYPNKMTSLSREKSILI